MRNLSSEKAFQEETLYWLLFAIIYAKWAPVFKHRNKIRLCPVQACQKKSTITLEGLKWFVFLLPLSQALNGDKLNFSSWFLFRDHCNRDLYNSCVLPTPTYSCITALSTQCKTPHLSLCWNVKVYATCDTLSQDCCVIHTMMEEKRLQSMPVTEFFTSYSSVFQQTTTFFFWLKHIELSEVFFCSQNSALVTLKYVLCSISYSEHKGFRIARCTIMLLRIAKFSFCTACILLALLMRNFYIPSF